MKLSDNLKIYNAWRRGDESIDQPDPKQIGQWIDAAIEIVKKYEESGREVHPRSSGR